MNFDRVTIRDPEADGMEGASLLVPEGWTTEGGFVWTPTLSMQATLPLRVSDPLTGASASTLSVQQFIWPMQAMPVPMQPGSNWLGSILLPPPESPAECVQRVYVPGPLQHLQGARLVGWADMPEVAAEAARDVPQRTVHATRLRYAFDWGGRPWEEDVYLSVTFDQPNGWTASWWCNAHALRAPAGMLDGMAPLLSVPMLSLRVSLDWSALLEHARGRFREALRSQQSDPGRRGLILPPEQPLDSAWRRQLAEIREAHRGAWGLWEASQDRQGAALGRVVGGLETYVDPLESRPAQLPPAEPAYWVGPGGRIVASAGPPAGGAAEWRLMYQPLRRVEGEPSYPAWTRAAGPSRPTAPAAMPPLPAMPPIPPRPAAPAFSEIPGMEGVAGTPAAPASPAGGYTGAEIALLEKSWTAAGASLDAEYEGMLREMEGTYELAVRVASMPGSAPGSSYGVVIERLEAWRAHFLAHRQRAFASEASRLSPYGQSLIRILEQVELRIADMAKRQAGIVGAEAESQREFLQGLHDARTGSLERRAEAQRKFHEALRKMQRR
jgi:hypothetical protein